MADSLLALSALLFFPALLVPSPAALGTFSMIWSSDLGIQARCEQLRQTVQTDLRVISVERSNAYKILLVIFSHVQKHNIQQRVCPNLMGSGTVT